MAIARGRGAGSALTTAEATRVAKLIRPELDRYVAKYDERKYPIPIIDQHNFRAMNHYFKVVRPEWSPKLRPSAYGDLSVLTAFVNDVRRAWRTVDPATLPSARTFDRSISHDVGKGLKVRQSRIRPTNALQRTGRSGR